MNRLRIIGLVLLAAILVGIAMFSLMPKAPPPAPPAEPVREAFHPTKPLQLHVQLVPAPDQAPVPAPPWISRELRHLLSRGKMKLAPQGASDESNASTFALRVTLKEDATRANLELVAPDGIVDKSVQIELPNDSQLAAIRSFAQHLPQFLAAPDGSVDWSAAIGSDDAAAYETFLRAGDELLSPDSTGFTAPPRRAIHAVQTVDRLEALNRRHRNFPRARALMALGYLSIGGDDQASLSKLAETAAERALAAEPTLADAQAALGIVRLRRMEWTAAREHFDAALALDASSLPALEGLGCLLMDVGHTKAALPIASRNAALQPGNRGARQCAAYARIANANGESHLAQVPSADIARIDAMISLLSGDRAAAAKILHERQASSTEIIEAIVAAGDSKSKAADALQVVTRSADEETIDAETELLFGTALRKPDFVFNRMLRLAKQNEAVPLRLLWLPQTEFLRKHRRFKEVVSATTLTTYWQDHGLPDVCATEPKVSGCAVKLK